jgi:hypothetical protein
MKSEQAIDLLLQPYCRLLCCSEVVQEICPGSIDSHGSLDVMLQIGSYLEATVLPAWWIRIFETYRFQIFICRLVLWSLSLGFSSYVLSPTGEWRPWRMDGI